MIAEGTHSTWTKRSTLWGVSLGFPASPTLLISIHLPSYGFLSFGVSEDQHSPQLPFRPPVFPVVSLVHSSHSFITEVGSVGTVMAKAPGPHGKTVRQILCPRSSQLLGRAEAAHTGRGLGGKQKQHI